MNNTLKDVQKELQPTQVLTIDELLLLKGGGVKDDKRRTRPGGGSTTTSAKNCGS
jgi:hypothetical protein